MREKVLDSFAHIARLEAAGRFPKRVPLGPGRVGYVEEEVDDWITRRIAERDQRTGSYRGQERPVGAILPASFLVTSQTEIGFVDRSRDFR